MEKQQYIDVIRSFAQRNKRMKIPGFSSMEKAPIKLVANTARTNKVFQRALLEAISHTMMPDAEVNTEQNIAEIKANIPQAQWLGLAAYLLMQEDGKYVAEAEQIISDFSAAHKQEKTLPVSEVDDTPKIDKKEEKFREKYLKSKSDQLYDDG